MSGIDLANWWNSLTPEAQLGVGSLAPLLVSLCMGLALHGLELFVPFPHAPETYEHTILLSPAALRAPDPEWVTDAEIALYERILERSDRGFAPRPGLGAMPPSSP